MTSDARIQLLLQKGVQIPNPASIQIGPEVDIQRISGKGVVLHSGSKLFGSQTALGPATVLGYEGPVTLENCQTGAQVALAGGFFSGSVFLSGSRMGSGAQVRAGCILEEFASGAHTVGLKQTILFPWVTLGSLINFCDCLMSGGTGRRNHSEVGSSYIHFNFTPNQDKATPSLLGDVPQGVMLRQPPIFLGGQGGLVGPTRLTFGTVTAAGTICRQDEERPGRLIFGGASRRGNVRYTTQHPLNLKRIIENNLIYMANILALQQWYKQVRKLFIGPAYSQALHEGALNILEAALTERIKRFRDFCQQLKAPETSDEEIAGNPFRAQRLQACETLIRDQLMRCRELEGNLALRDRFLTVIIKAMQGAGPGDYLNTIQGLDTTAVALGTSWLEELVQTVVNNVLTVIANDSRHASQTVLNG